MRSGHKVSAGLTLVVVAALAGWKSNSTCCKAAGPHVERELALIKVKGSGPKRIEALRIAEVFRARVVDATSKSFVFEVTGNVGKINSFIELMRPLGLFEICRTGVAAIARGEKGV